MFFFVQSLVCFPLVIVSASCLFEMYCRSAPAPTVIRHGVSIISMIVVLGISRSSEVVEANRIVMSIGIAVRR